MHQAAYRFFDAAFLLETDSPEFLAFFDRAYGALRACRGDDGAVYRVLLEGRPECHTEGDPVRSASREAMRLYAYNAILNAALARVRSHWLFHGAALASPGGRGVILAGAAGLGKTTLALALLDRGFGFLSDDVAAVDRTGGLLCPFPRAMGRRVAGAPPGEKELLKPLGIAPPLVLTDLLVLAGDNSGAGTAWYAVVDRSDCALAGSLEAIEGIGAVESVRGEPYPALRLDAAPGVLPAAEPDVETACRRHGVLLFELVRGRVSAPAFDGEPSLEPLPAAEAAHELLQHLKGGPRAGMVRDLFGGSLPRLYMALTGVTAGIACRRLRVGRLEAMVDQIVSVVEG